MATGSPLVSVVIPTYNRWPMIEEAVGSVFAQSYPNFEIILIDDGSTDGTAGLLRLRDRRLRIHSQPKLGVAAARNAGAALARGKYLAFLDSDDLWRQEKLARQVALMEHTTAVDICQTEEIWLRNGVRVNPRLRHKKPSGDIFRRSLDLCLISPSAVMMTVELFFRAGRFDETFPVCEDYDLWLRIAVEHPVALISAPMVIKRGGHADQLSRSCWGMDRYRVRAIAKLLRAGISGDKRIWAVHALSRKIAILASGARKRGREREAREYESIRAEFAAEGDHAGSDRARICVGQGFSSGHATTLA